MTNKLKSTSKRLGVKLYNLAYTFINFIAGSSTDNIGYRRKRFVFLLLVFVIADILLGKNITSGRYPWYANVSIFLLLNVNILLVLALFVLLFRNIAKLMADRHQRIFGSRIQTKLVIFSVILVVVPVCTTYFMSTKLIRDTIDRWFDNNVMTLRNDSTNLIENYQKNQVNDLMQKLTISAGSLSALNITDDGLLDTAQAMDKTSDYIELHVFNGVSIYNIAGAAYVQQNTPSIPFDFITKQILNDIFKGQNLSGFVTNAEVPYYWAGVPITINDTKEVIGALFAYNFASTELAKNMYDIKGTNELLQQLRFFSDPVHKAFNVSQFMIALLVVVGCIWGSMIFVHSLTDPLKNLAIAANKLSRGQRDTRVMITGNDEITLVARSFNEMAEKLNRHTLELQTANEELQDALNQISRDKQYIDTIYRNVDSALILLDSNLNMLKMNKYAENLIQKSSQSFHSFALKLVTDFINSGESEQIVQSIHQDGEESKQYIAHINKIFDINGKLENILLVLDDNTHVMNLQRITLWKEVASRITHEIKNPLTPIKLIAERVRRRSKNIIDAPLKELVDTSMQTIINETDDLLNLVEEFSLYARMPSIIRTDILLASLLQEVVGLQSRLNPSVAIECDIADEIAIKGDKYQLKRVFINLIQNSIQAMDKPDGVIKISALTTDNGKVAISIADNGSGITEDDLAHIFVPYFSKKPSGTGLGLAIVKKIIEEHDGSISAESVLGEYTVFHIILSMK